MPASTRFFANHGAKPKQIAATTSEIVAFQGPNLFAYLSAELQLRSMFVSCRAHKFRKCGASQIEAARTNVNTSEFRAIYAEPVVQKALVPSNTRVKRQAPTFAHATRAQNEHARPRRVAENYLSGRCNA
jgi:hypothetical protein